MVCYEKSLLSLVSSILVHYGVVTPHATLPAADVLLEKGYQSIVVMVFDGMGAEILRNHLPKDSFLRRHQRGILSSVFPPTTTAATVTLESGLSPVEHGWLGWKLFFREVDANVSVFPNTVSGRPAAEYHLGQRHLSYETTFRRVFNATGGAVGVHHVSNFSTISPQRYTNVAEVCAAVKACCQRPGRQYVYSYWHQPDYDMHDYGTDHTVIAETVLEIDREVEILSSALRDTLIFVTADHGLIDTEWRFLQDYPQITDCFLREPSIESRAMTFFVKKNSEARFETAFREAFGDCYRLYTREEVFAGKLFGEGTPHPRTKDFVGNYLAVATGSVSIEPGEETGENLFRAAHAGMTTDELEVPFVIIET